MTRTTSLACTLPVNPGNPTATPPGPSPESAQPGTEAHWVDSFLSQLAAAPRQSGHGSGRDGLLALLAQHDNPQRRLRVVRIAGSKGKGSTALIMEALLRRAGYRVGLFASPHLERWNERIRIDGRDIDSPTLARILGKLAPAITRLRNRANPTGPDFFEVMLVTALLAFEQARVDWVLLECGIGARGDATAVSDAALSVITRIEREHAELIGPRIRDIALEKSGVMAPGRVCIAGRLNRMAAGVVEAEAGAQGAALQRLGHEFRIRRQREGQQRLIRYSDELGSLRLRVQPSLFWLADNVATAVAAVRHLPDAGLADDGIVDALAGLQLPGRLEFVAGHPVLLIDCAHTRASSSVLARVLESSPPRGCVLVFGMSRGHDPAVLSPTLWRRAERIIVTLSDPIRGLDPDRLAARLRQLCPVPVEVVTDPTSALSTARARAGACGLVGVAGSVYLAGIARAFARPLARAAGQATSGGTD